MARRQPLHPMTAGAAAAAGTGNICNICTPQDTTTASWASGPPSPRWRGCATGDLLAELRLEEFEPAFRELGVDTLEGLASTRYEALLEMGLSKVQCHLLLEKAACWLDGGAGGGSGGQEEAGAAAAEEEVSEFDEIVRDALLTSDEAVVCVAGLSPLASGETDDAMETGGALPWDTWEHRARRLKAALQMQSDAPMLPPASCSLAAAEALRLRKRPHSSHLSTVAARGSERPTGSSASCSSSSSLHMDISVKKRRVLEKRVLHRGGTSSFVGSAVSWENGRAGAWVGEEPGGELCTGSDGGVA